MSENRNLARIRRSSLNGKRRRNSLPDLDRGKDFGQGAKRPRSQSRDDITGQSNTPVNIAFGRKISDETLIQDINTTLDQVGGNFGTKDVLEKLAKDFEVAISPVDSEQQILNKLKDDRAINQDDYDFIQNKIATVKTRRKISDDLLRENIDNAKAQGLEQEFSVKAILEQLARDFETNILPTDTEQNIRDKLITDRVINSSDYDFIVANTDQQIGLLRAEAVQKADEIATATIARMISDLEQEAESRKSSLLKKTEAEALLKLSNTNKKGIEKPKDSPKYIKAKKALEKNIRELSGKATAKIDSDLQDDKQRLQDIGLKAEKKRQYEGFENFLNNTNYDPFSFDALATAGNFNDAERLVASVNRKPNLQALATPQYYDLLNNALRILGENTTDAIIQRINPGTFAQFGSLEDDGLIFLRELNARGGIANGKLRDVGNQILKIAPLISQLNSKRNFANLLANDNVADVLNLVGELKRFNIHQRINVLHTLRPHTTNANALRQGLQIANRLGWTAGQIQAQLTALPLGSGTPAIRNHIYANALGIFDKNTHFNSWIKSLNLLMEEAGYTLTVSNSFPLSGGNTRERTVDIYDGGGNYQDDFVIHYHPGAGKAKVGSPYASNKHIKPVRGNSLTKRLYWDGSIPNTLKAALPSQY